MLAVSYAVIADRAVVIAVRPYRALCALTLVLSLEMSVGDFIAVQQLTDDQRRRRFGLPDACVPTITALRAARGGVHVVVTCSDATPPAPRVDPGSSTALRPNLRN
ncbi:MAG: hypothetical protein HYR51_10030 [Candidatus Rokubacteria bacterium]|nr:hypothetical protein [Candidatus Rokubacteria bacterium]